MEQELLSVLETARELRVSDARVRRLILDGRLPATKVGNYWVIRRNDLEQFKRQREGRAR